MNMRIIASGLALISASPAVAAEWWIVLQRDGAGNVHFGDTAQLRRDGDNVLFWSHLFHKDVRDGMKSARIQYEVRCKTSEMRERRYLDFDIDRQVIETGDNTEVDGWKEVGPETSGAAYVAFACGTPEARKSKHLSVAENIDIFELAEFFLDPREIVKIEGAEGKTQ